MTTNTRFGWVYEIIFCNPERLNNYIIPQTLVSPVKVSQGTNGVSPDGIVLKKGDYLDYNTIPPEFRKITDLHFKAKITQNKELRTPSVLEIINLSDEDLNFLRQDTTVILRAGYKQDLTRDNQNGDIESLDLPDIFVGQIKTVVTTPKGVDYITLITMGEGLTVQRNSRISKSYPPRTTRLEVIEDMLKLIGDTGLPTGGFKLPPNNSKEYRQLTSPYISGYSMFGNSVEELEKVCASVGLRVFMANGKVYVEPKVITQDIVVPFKGKTAVESREIYNITPDNVLGNVAKLKGNITTAPSNADDTADVKQLTADLYLDGNISTGKIARLTGFEEDFDGEYEITSVVFNMDYSTSSKNWKSKVTLQELK